MAKVEGYISQNTARIYIDDKLEEVIKRDFENESYNEYLVRAVTRGYEYSIIEFTVDPWCKCRKEPPDAYYVADGVHEEISKHHWRCNDCDGIVQIG